MKLHNNEKKERIHPLRHILNAAGSILNDLLCPAENLGSCVFSICEWWQRTSGVFGGVSMSSPRGLFGCLFCFCLPCGRVVFYRMTNVLTLREYFGIFCTMLVSAQRIQVTTCVIPDRVIVFYSGQLGLTPLHVRILT